MTQLQDALAAPAFLACNLLLLAGAWRWSGRQDPGAGLVRRIQNTTLCWMGVVVAASLVLGAAGVLYPGLLLAAAAVVASVGLWRAGPAPPSSPAGPGGEERYWVVVWGVLAAFWAGAVVRGGLLAFPSSWDACMYHIPLIDSWLQAHGLLAPDCRHWWVPGNSELVGLWFVAPFSGDFLISLSNVPFAVLLACSVVELARGLGLSPAWAHFAGLAATASRLLGTRLSEAENDLAVAALFAAGLSYAAAFAREQSRACLGFGAVATGMLAGTKYYALGYAGIAGSVLALAAVSARPRGRHLAAATALAAGWGGYWYLRNLLVTGTPFYPLGAAVGESVFPEYPGSLWHSTLLGCGHPEAPRLVVEAVFRYMGPWFGVALLAAPLSLAWALASGVGLWVRDQPRAAVTRLTLVGVVLASALVYVITPFAVEDAPGTYNQLLRLFTPARYGMAVWTACALAAAVVLHDLAGLARARSGAGHSAALTVGWLAGGVMAAAAAAQVWGQLRPAVRLGIDGLLAPALLLLLAARVWGCVAAWPSSRRRILWASAATAVAAGAVVIPLLGGRWHHDFADHYDRLMATRIFTRHFNGPADPGRTVCVLAERVYPFFGSARQHRLCQPYSVSSPDEVLDYMRGRRAESLVVEVLFRHQTERPATYSNHPKGLLTWFPSRPEVFQPVSTTFPLLYYHIQPALATSAAPERAR
jgi:hypothetical protein